MGDNTKMAARYAEYCWLRDAGVGWLEASYEVGITPHGAGQRYERSYRKGQPRETRPQQFSSNRPGRVH